VVLKSAEEKNFKIFFGKGYRMHKISGNWYADDLKTLQLQSKVTTPSQTLVLLHLSLYQPLWDVSSYNGLSFPNLYDQ
jgi:hypothetical protein